MGSSSVEDMFAHAVSLPRPPFRETQLPSVSQRWGPRFGPLSLAGHLPAGLQGAQRMDADNASHRVDHCSIPGPADLRPWRDRWGYPEHSAASLWV